MKSRRILNLAALVGVALCATGARQFNGTSQYINMPAAAYNNTPMTIAAWAFMDSTNNAISVGSVTSGSLTRHQIAFNAGGFPFASAVNTGGTPGTAQGSTAYSSNQWYHLAGVFVSSTDRRVYVDGVPQATNTTAITLGVVDRTTIGMRISSGAVGTYWAGRIAEFAVWSAQLTEADLRALAAGAKPTRVRPDALMAYFPLPGEASPEPNWKGTAGNLTNAPTQGSHPRVY